MSGSEVKGAVFDPVSGWVAEEKLKTATDNIDARKISGDREVRLYFRIDDSGLITRSAKRPPYVQRRQRPKRPRSGLKDR